jgi:hypothetical protein
MNYPWELGKFLGIADCAARRKEYGMADEFIVTRLIELRDEFLALREQEEKRSQGRIFALDLGEVPNVPKGAA